MEPQATQQTQPQQFPPTPTPSPMSAMPPEHKKVGPIIAILIIVLILVIGALYLFASRLNQQQPEANNNVANTNTSTEPQNVAPVTNSSDDVDSIEADLNTSVQGLDGQNF